jgi:hypothetical protein
VAGTRLLAPEGTTSGASIVSEVPETTPEGMTVPGEKVAFCKFVPAGTVVFAGMIVPFARVMGAVATKALWVAAADATLIATLK